MTPGARLGRYELVAPLGEGGMGQVWEAVLHGPAGFRKPVALKLLHPSVTQQRFTDALVREARVGALLGHPNIVAVHDLVFVDERWLVAMEIVRGATARELLGAGPLPGRALRDLAVQAATGLARIHAAGSDPAGAVTWSGDEPPPSLVHRDIKPSNLLVDRTGVVKVADLGLARLTGGARSRAGTPGYLAPEQYDGHAVPASDQFALASTLYELATGRPLLGHGQAGLAALLDLEGRVAAAAWDRVDAAVPGLAAVLRRALVTDPAQRWPDVRAMKRALAALRPGGPGLVDVLAAVRPELDTGDAQSSGDRRTGNLVVPPDAFVGRGPELEAVGARLRSGRVLTLLGPGGIGKTRLAVHLADGRRAAHPGGAWFVDCAEATTARGVCAAVGGVLGVKLAPDAADQLGHALGALGRAVVVLDNLEQVVAATGPLVARWLVLAPEVAFVATSRVALRVRGEVPHPVPPLRIGDGAALFRARARRPLDDDAADVAALVAALDGLPLAIELAAARTAVLPVARIVARLGDRLRLLATRDPDRPARQRSMRASLDASWDLLDDVHRSALAQLTVFDGAFTLEMAEVVLELDDAWALDVVQGLVDASLVRVAGDRFQLSVLVRAYAAEHLGEPLAAHVRHARAHADAAEVAIEELVVAFHRMVDARRGTLAADVLERAWVGLRRRGPLTAAVDLAERALAPHLGVPARMRILRVGWEAAREASQVERARALVAAADRLALQVGGSPSLWMARAALRWRDGDVVGAERCLLAADLTAVTPGEAIVVARMRGRWARVRGRLDAAREHYRAGAALADAHGDTGEAIRVRYQLAGVLWSQRDLDGAVVEWRRVEQLAERTGDADARWRALSGLGVARVCGGEPAAALGLFDRAAAITARLGLAADLVMNLVNRSELCMALGRLAEARSALVRAGATVDRRETREQALVWVWEARFALVLGQPEVAARHAARAEAAADRTDRENAGLVEAVAVEVALAGGAWSDAARRAAALAARLRDVDFEQQLPVVAGWWARALAEAGDAAGARAVLADHPSDAEWPHVAVRAHLARGRALRALGEDAAADAALAAGLDLADRTGQRGAALALLDALGGGDRADELRRELAEGLHRSERAAFLAAGARSR